MTMKTPDGKDLLAKIIAEHEIAVGELGPENDEQ